MSHGVGEGGTGGPADGLSTVVFFPDGTAGQLVPKAAVTLDGDSDSFVVSAEMCFEKAKSVEF